METSIDSSFRSDSGEQPCRILMTVMQNSRELIDAADELNDIKAAEDAVLKKDDERAVVVDKLQDELRLLAAQYQSAAAAAQRPKGTPSATEHEAHVRDLEQRQYAIGKALNEEQGAVARREVEIGRAKAEREEVRRWDPTENVGNEAHVLRLKIFEELGFKLLEDRPAKILIRNDSRPDLHVETVGADRVRSANLLWEYAS